MDSLTIDGLELPVQRPESVAALCELVKAQRAKKEAIYPVGGRTMLDFGLPPTKPGVAVDMTALNQVIDYPARDMTITVQAGITFAKMQKILAQEGQWLPLDVPDPERMTIGGLIAANVSGPRRYGYGTLRDYVIGISFVTDDGVEVKGGGRVVKNVAGYDLMKLHIGALGTMGIITQVTLKVLPKPDSRRIINMEVKSNQLENVLEKITRSQTRPIAVSLDKDNEDSWFIAIGFEGNQYPVDWQMKTLESELNPIISANLQELNETHDIWQSVCLIQTIKNSFLSHLSVKPSEIVSLLLSDVIVSDHHVIENCDPLLGSIWISGQPTISSRYAMIVRKAPTAWKTPERVFGKPTPAFELMRHIKRTLDPDDVFNPGRMF